MITPITSLLLRVVCCLLIPVAASAQSVDARLIGVVQDATGGPLPGATVTVSSPTAGLSRSTTADTNGLYTLFNLPAGAYTLRAELQGFAPSSRDNQTLHVGTTVTIDFVLTVEAVSENVIVRGTLAAPETSKNSLTRIVEQSEIDSLPVISRSFNELAALAPGVTKTGTYGGVDISGSRDFQNAYQLDGVSAERHHLGDQRVGYSQDWVQEFQVFTGQFNAEFGQASGGVLNVITRSGTNQLTGRVYGFFRDDAWDALPAFTTQKPPLEEHRIGATAGGPLLKNRVFFFGGIERFDNESSNVVNSTFPSANGIVPSTEGRTLALVKIDAFAGPSHAIRVRHNLDRLETTGAQVGGISTEEHGRFMNTSAADTAGSWTWVGRAAYLNEVRAAFSGSTPKGGCNFAAANPPGTWFERMYPGAHFGCPVNFGTIAEDQFQLIDNFHWSGGAHDVKAGAHVVRTRSFGDFRNFRDGRYSFERDIPFDIARPDSYPFSFVVIEGPTAWDVAGWSAGMFAQDHWRLSNDLVVNAGIRYDLDGSLTALNPLVRTDRQLARIEADIDNIAPRVGVAWTPFADRRGTLIRGGAGLYYDQNHNNVAAGILLNNILVDRTVVVNANNPALNPFWPDVARAKAVLAAALAQNTTPDVSRVSGIAAATSYLDSDLQVPSTTQVSGGVAHELWSWLNASADIVYARGNELYVIRNTNLNPVTFAPINPNYSTINAFGNGGRSRYKALQVQVNAVPEPRTFVKLAYTLASNRSNTAATLSTGASTNPFDLSEDEGPTDQDVRHILALNGAHLLPLDIELSGIVSYRSGLPFSATTNASRPDGKPFGFRPEPRNARRGDSSFSIDVRFGKSVRFGNRHNAIAFVEIFNLTNQLNYGNYIGTITSSRFGEPTTATPKRRLQLGFRVDF